MTQEIDYKRAWETLVRELRKKTNWGIREIERLMLNILSGLQEEQKEG